MPQPERKGNAVVFDNSGNITAAKMRKMAVKKQKDLYRRVETLEIDRELMMELINTMKEELAALKPKRVVKKRAKSSDTK